MSKVLVTAKRDWADEFDAVFLKVFDESEWLKHLEQVKRYFETNENAEVYFGTNEFIDYYDYEDYVSTFTVKKISAEEAATIEKLVYPKYYHYFGQNILIDDIEDEDE